VQRRRRVVPAAARAPADYDFGALFEELKEQAQEAPPSAPAALSGDAPAAALESNMPQELAMPAAAEAPAAPEFELPKVDLPSFSLPKFSLPTPEATPEASESVLALESNMPQELAMPAAAEALAAPEFELPKFELPSFSLPKLSLPTPEAAETASALESNVPQELSMPSAAAESSSAAAAEAASEAVESAPQAVGVGSGAQPKKGQGAPLQAACWANRPGLQARSKTVEEEQDLCLALH